MSPLHAAGTLHLIVFLEGAAGSLEGISVQHGEERPALTNGEGAARLSLPEGQQCVSVVIPPGVAGAVRGAEHELCDLLIVGGESTQVILTLDATGQRVLLVDIMAPGDIQAARQAEAQLEKEMAEKPRGRLRGVLRSLDEKAPIAGARVFVRGLPVESTSDAEGRFELELPEGIYQLSIIHSKFSTYSQEGVAVKGNAETSLELDLSPAAAELDDFVVTAPYIQGGVASIMTERRRSSSVTDALGSEELAKSPDNSASSATRRIVGASIIGGQFLLVRGLGGRYSNARLNGVPLPSTDPDLPGFQLDLFPANLLSALTIAKTFSPNIPGDFAGGSLNVETRGFPETFKLSASIGVSYNTETTGQSMPSYTGGALDFLGIDDGTRALPEGVPDQQVSTVGGLTPDQVSDVSRRFPNKWQLGERLALPNLSLGLSVGDTLDGSAGRLGYLLTLGYRHKYERYIETTTKVGLMGTREAPTAVALETLEREIGVREAQLGALGTITYEPGADQRLTVVSLLTQNGEDRASFLSGRTETEGTNVQLTQMRFIERRLLFNQLLGEHNDLADLLSISWQLNLSSTLREQPDSRGLLYTEGPNGFQFSNTSGSGERLYTDLAQADYGGGLNLSFSLTEQTQLQLGYLGRIGDRDFVARRMGVQILGTPTDRLLPAEQLLAPERAGELWRVNEVTRVDDGFTASEDLHAGYAMLETPTFDGLRVMLGARVESFHQSIDVVPPFELVGQMPPAGGDRSDLDYLPSAAIIVSPTDNMNVRGAYGGTVARPLVRELAPFLSQDFVRRRTIVGNPALERTFIHNFDLRWELFPTPTEVFAISAFYKRFDRPIEGVIRDTAGNITFSNIDAATSYGAELEARLGLGALSDALEHFSAFANLALIRSRVSLSDEQRGTATLSERPLAGQSPYVANLSLGYEPDQTGLSAYVYYNVFGRRIQEVGRLGLPDVYEEPFHSLDATVFWKTKSQLTLGLSASNLLLQPVALTQGGLDFSRSERGANLGLTLSWAP